MKAGSCARGLGECVLRSGLAIALAGCGGRKEGRTDREQEAEPLTIAVPDSVAVRLTLDSVRRVQPGPVRFAALVEADRDHRQVVVAVASGEARVVALARAGPVRPGDSIGVLHLVHRPDTSLVLRAPATGRWSPGRHHGAIVWPGDTVGIVQLPGWLVAVGQVSDAGTAPVRIGDSADIELEDAPATRHRASVTSAVTDGFGSTEVRLHYHTDVDTPALDRIVHVVAFPSESLLVVPARGLGNTSRGPALFLPRGDRRFQVRFVTVDPHSSLGIVIHRGLERPTPVATGDLRALQAAAEDSLAARRGRPR